MNFASLCPLLTEKNQHLMQRSHEQGWMILSDFDGTISLKDVTDAILEQFADPRYEQVEQEWLEGKIGSKSCMSQQVALIEARKKELDDFLTTIEIDPYFADFVQFITERKWALQVVSDGLDYAIQTVLAQFDLPIFANQLLYNGDKSWQISFPYANDSCLKQSGNCKCHHLAEQKKQAPMIIYIGDGASDFCVVPHADLIFAKDKLIDYCQKNQLAHVPFRHFGEIQEYLSQHNLTQYQTKIGAQK